MPASSGSLRKDAQIAFTWLDRAIGFFSPRAALLRYGYRRAMMLSYEGARVDRRTSGWTAPGTSGNAEVLGALHTLRDRSRDLIRNNELAMAASEQWATKVVGYGVTGRTADLALTALWTEWAASAGIDGETFDALQDLAVRSEFADGEVLIRRIWWPGRGVPMRIQVLEADHLDLYRIGQGEAKGSEIQQGVERDRRGAIVAYWLHPRHPGGVSQWGTGAGWGSVRVPASEVHHMRRLGRPGQERSVPRLTASMVKLRDLADYEDAEIIRKKTEACLAAFVTSNEDISLGLQTTEANSAGSTDTVEAFRPGMVTRLRTGENVTTVQPSHAGGYAEYVREQIRGIAAGLSMPYELVRGDLSQTNYSSSRLGFVAFRHTIDRYREHVLFPMLNQVAQWFVEAAFAAGMTSLQRAAFTWSPPPFDMLDRGAEAEADAREMAQGGMTWPQYIQARGLDPYSQADEMIEWREKLEKAGVVFSKAQEAIFVQRSA